MRRGRGVPSQLRTEPAVLVSTIQVEDGVGLLQTRLSSHTHPAGPWLERKSERDCGRRKVASQVQLPGYLEVGKGRGAAVTQAARAGGERREGLWGGASGVALSFAAFCRWSPPPARERGGEGFAVSRLSLQRKRDPGPQVEAGGVGRGDALLFSHSLSDSASIA